MNSENEAAINLLLDFYDITAGLMQSAEGFKNDRNDDDKQKVKDALDKIKNEWTSYEMKKDLFPNSLFQAAQATFSAIETRANEFLPAVTKLCDKVTDLVCLELITKSRNEDHITKPIAERIFKLYDNAKHTPSVFQLLSESGMKSSVTAPKESYEYLMKLLDENPKFLSGKDLIHPGYVYEPSHQQRIFDKCPICGGESEPYYNGFSYRMQHFDKPHEPFKLWRKCTACGNLHTWKFPEEFLELSSHEKMINPDEDKKYSILNVTNAVSLSIWSNILNKLKAYNNKKTLLEVGIGHGELLSVALEMGYDVNAVEIVEESAREVSDVLNISIWNGDFLNFKSDKTFPIIIMGDIIEHVTDPEKALKSAYDLLDSDGVLWLSTPNFESSFSRLRKFTDPMWVEPLHITYFNYSGLEALLEKCGFAVREYTVSNRYNGSMELIITKK